VIVFLGTPCCSLNCMHVGNYVRTQFRKFGSTNIWTVSYTCPIKQSRGNVDLDTPMSLVLITDIHCTLCVCNNNSQNLSSKCQVYFGIGAHLRNLKCLHQHFFSISHSINADIQNAVQMSRFVLPLRSGSPNCDIVSKPPYCHAFSLMTRRIINEY